MIQQAWTFVNGQIRKRRCHGELVCVDCNVMLRSSHDVDSIIIDMEQVGQIILVMNVEFVRNGVCG